MPHTAKWTLIAGLAILCMGAAYLMFVRGPAILLDLGGALASCF